MKPNIAGFLRYYLLGCLMIVGDVGLKTMAMNVGVIVDLNSWIGKMGLNCINISFSDFYASHPNHNQTISLHIRDSKADPLIAATQAEELIQKIEVEAILGPEKWGEAYFVSKLGEKAEVPIISFAPPTTTTTSTLSYSFQVAQTHSSQVEAISHIITTFKWKHVVIIYNDQDDDIGIWFAADLTNALQDTYVHVHKTLLDSTISSNHIKQKLYRLTLRQARVFVVHLDPNLASRVFAMAHQLGMMSQGYVWIVTSATANVLNSLNSSTLYTMQGVLGVKTYVPTTSELDNFTTRWRRKFQLEIDVNGLWAYDAAWALAMAVERIGSTHPNFTSGVSGNGKKIRESLLNTKFKGLSGEVNLVNKGRLKWGNLEIVNVLGNEEKPVGYWRPEMGLTGEMNRKSNLKEIIWPGYSVKVPKGWGRNNDSNAKKKLRIAVTRNDEFSDFAGVFKKGTMVGYSIDIFEAAVAQLPYNISFQYIHFEDMPSSSDSYNDLIYQVYKEKYDAAIGDISILANRALYVDFTLPFTEAGIGAVIPVKHHLRNHAWVFLKPLTLNLWITSFCFFIFMGFVVWILEHRNHQQYFRGPPSRQIGTGLWFSFCTIVFAHWETLVSNLARLVVVVWFFVVFILTQSYTASLTSWLTVQQLQPMINIDQIIKNDWNVGYQRGSYVLKTLQLMGIKNLIPYTSLDQLHELFTNGSIDAVIDEIPYLKLFLLRYENDYTIADSLFKGKGFGFAFPLGSCIVEDMSKAMLNVTESDMIMQIQEKWFGKKNEHWLGSYNESSSIIDLTYFWTLFLIATCVAIFALLLYFFRFIRNQTSSLTPIYSWISTLWTTIIFASTFHIFRFINNHPWPPRPSRRVLPTTMTPSTSTEGVNEFPDSNHQNQPPYP